MSVRKLDKGKYIMDYYPQGRKGKRIRTVYEGPEGEARALELELRRNNAGLPNPTNPKIMDVLPEYKDWMTLHRAPKTITDYKSALKFLVPHFGKLPVSRIMPTIITQYQKARAGTPRACIKELNYMRAIIRWMVEHNYANPLPFKIQHLRYKAPLPQVPHPADIEKFIAEINDPLKKALVLLMYQAGLRFEDARNIRWEKIEWDSDTVNLTETKGDVPRICILPEDVKRLLQPLRQESGYVFESKRTGKPVKSLKTLFRSACKRAGIHRFSPHKLRHAFGTYALEATDNLRLVQELLGHKSISSTTIYTQISTHRKRLGMTQTHEYIERLKEKRNNRKA
ncbi:MAG: tyrosine-type recombinase/integrase [Thermodesulfovibrionales bacterium]|nr:tyrosine-type recombinase/integrase [Thermodesulfovibrionales bacterium]